MKSYRPLGASLVAMAAAALLGGCVPHPPVQQPWYGKTQTLAEVAAAVNANNARLPTLWASHEYDIRFTDKDGKSHIIVGDGVLMYRRPREMLFVGSKAGAGRIFIVGSNAATYWMDIIPEEATQWHGSYANVGRAGVKALPIRPDLLIDVLGIGEIDKDFLKLPAPTMRFNPDQWAYMLIWNEKLPDRWWAQKEIWYDLEHHWPTKVILYDQNGRVVVRANLGQHKRVNIPDTKEEDRPVVPTEYKLFFPDSKATMLIQLQQVMLQNKAAPREGSIQFRPDPGLKQVNLDEQAE